MAPGARAPSAMILCAGLGTRLRPLTSWRAKPMVPVGDQPVVGHIAAALRASVAIERLVVNVHHRPEDVVGWAEGAGAIVSHEPTLLGTAGGIAKARAFLGEGDVLVWNGDILCPLDPAALLAAHATPPMAKEPATGRVSSAEEPGKTRAPIATLAVRRRSGVGPGPGNVGLDAEGRVVRLRDVRAAVPGTGDAAVPNRGVEVASADFVGISVLGAGLLRDLPSTGCLVGDVLIPAIVGGAFVASFDAPPVFEDIGSLGAYVAANRAWLAARGLASWASPSAMIAAAIDGSVVGDRARVDAPAIRAIVWPDTHVTTPIVDVVATPFGHVPIG